MKKITWMQGAFALIAALMLVLPTRAEVAFATDLFGTYKFTATVDAFVDEAGNDYSAFYKEECEVKITRCSYNIFEGEIQGLAGATAVQSIKSIDLETNTIKISSPNGSNGNGLWGGGLYMSNSEGVYPFGGNYYDILYTFDPVTKTITLPDFTLVTCDHANSATTIVASFTNVKMTLVQSENIDVTDLSGDWHYTAGKGTYDTMEGSTLPTEWDMTLTATDNSKKAYNISLTLGDFAPLALIATFDGVTLTIPFNEDYFDAEQKIGLVNMYGVARPGTITFNIANENLLTLVSGMSIAQDSISPEVPGGYKQWYLNGSAKRQGGETEKVAWEGTYKMKAESVTEVKAIEGFTYPAEFDIVVTYNADYDICQITEFMGCDVKLLNYGGISLNVSDSEPNKAEIATTTAYLKTIVSGESYLTLKDKNAGTAPILLTLNTDGTITIDNFTVTYMTYDESLNLIHTLAAYYQMTTGGNDLIIKDEYATLCDSVDTVIAELEILGVTTLMNEFVEGYNKIKVAVSANMISKEEGCELLVKALETVQAYRAEYDALLALVKEAEAEMEKGALEHLSVALDEVKLLIANPANATIDDFKAASENLKDAMATVPIFRIVTRSDVELTVTNDSIYPWWFYEEDQCITNGNYGVKYSTSTASISYKSDYKTELKLDWVRYSSQSLQLYVDGELKASEASGSYSIQRMYLNAGEHVIAIQYSIGNSTSTNNWSRIKNLSIKEICPLEDSLLTAKSERITFENDGEYLWTWEDGYAQSSNYGHSNAVSKLSTTFTVEEPSKFSFEVCVNGRHYSSEYHILGVDIDEKRYGSYSGNSSWSSSTGWIRKSVLLDPGKYTIEFLDSVNYSDSRTVSRLRNVELHSDWLEIELPSAGTLGAEVLYQLDVLGDVELLRVKGTLNAEDWAIINNMDNLVGLDLTEARFDAVPDYAFDGQSYLSSVKLPEGMTSIGQYAFRGTQIWKIQIPATVTSIGQYAFASTRLEEITFPENSQLTTIGFRAFGNCASLKEFIMPNTVTVLKEDGYGDSEAFYQCSSLKKLHFSDALTHIPEYTCYECYRLSDVHWPKGLVSIGYRAFRDVDDLCSLEFPETLTSIGGECFWSSGLTHVVLPAKLTSLGDNAFIHCDGLKCIEFPSYIERYYYTLQYCTALDTIVCHAPTPPAVAGDILSGGRAKSDVTLIVPAFSAVSYKLDSYWYQYGNIVASEEVQDYWRVAGDLALTNNRRMGGKPDIDLYYNGRMLVGGDAAFEAGIMNFFINESQPARLLNNCPTVNVDSVNTYYSVNANTWYFFTPLYDVKVSDVTMSNDASYVIRYYDGAVRASAGTGSSWTDVPKDSVLLAGQGYIFRCNKACVVNIPADRSVHAQLFDFAAKEIALETHETETEANRNWNYVGNPYPCYYDIWYMDFTAPITVWTGSTYAAYSVTDDDFVLRPMQSFFVQKPDGVDSIRFRTEGRQLTNTVAHASYAARSTAPRFVFNLEIGTDSVADRTRVVFNATRSMDYELACDASKFMSMDATVPQIYSLDEKGNRLAINERPKADGRVALGVYVAQAGEYTLSASRMDGKATLYDALTDSYTDLSETSYTFRAEGTGYIEDRFELMLEVPGGATGIDETGADTTVKVTVKEGFIRVSGAEGTAVQLYSIDGKQLQSQTISGGNVLFVVPADGVYVVTANGVSQKAVVQEGWR